MAAERRFGTSLKRLNCANPGHSPTLGERAKSTDSVEEPLQPNEGKERGDDDQYWAR
jgi:hypothetical protein